jgi:hypothetical protein
MLLGHMRNEVFCLDASPGLLTLLAINQLRAPGTDRVKAHAKLGSALGVHADNALTRIVNEGRHTAGLCTQRAKTHA